MRAGPRAVRSHAVLVPLAGGVGFDSFLTAPYLSLPINRFADVQSLIALLVVGIAVTELAPGRSARR